MIGQFSGIPCIPGTDLNVRSPVVLVDPMLWFHQRKARVPFALLVILMMCLPQSKSLLMIHNQQFVSWVYLYPITAAAENTLISMGNTFSTCAFFESETNRTSVQTDCTILVFSKQNVCLCLNF